MQLYSNKLSSVLNEKLYFTWFTKRIYCNQHVHYQKKNKKSNWILKGEKHTQMKYVNKLPSHKRNFSLMATPQSGPPGLREMSIFITRPPPHPIWEGGRQPTCPYLPYTLSLQPKRGSGKRRQFPWNIRIKRTWKEGKGWKGKLITQKWIRNMEEKTWAGSSGGGRAGLYVPYENGCM